MAKRHVGLDVCPYCRSDDIQITDNRPERDDEFPVPDLLCQDYVCQKCKGVWTVEYRPRHYYRYEGDDFVDKPEPFVEVKEGG